MLENLHYDVFISYRHRELDGFIAEKLHKMLEGYRVPNAVAKKIGRKKLSRVFRDRDELPTSSNLSESIIEALKNSDFLLLICSKRTCESQWVMREVEIFGELHGKDKIITLLIDGEPDESFPPGLRERKIGDEIIFVEPLAADIRADLDGKIISKTRDKDWNKSLKLLKEEKLRLLAPILGCAYDHLRRRHRSRRIRRTITGLSAAFTFALSFGAFSTYQYIQIENQMRLKLENESYVLSEYSAAAYADGDRDTAVLLALEALPKNTTRPERPMVRAAERALAHALGIYDVSDTFKPHKTFTLPAAPVGVMLSPNETRAAVTYPFAAAVIDTGTGNIIKTLPAFNSVLAGACFLSEDIIVYSGTGGMTAYDIAGDTVWWQADHEVTAVSVSADKTKTAGLYSGGNGAVIYSADGAKISEISFGGRKIREPADNMFNPNDILFGLNEDGSKLAVSFDNGSLAVFNTADSSGSIIYPESNAVSFTGGFYRGALFFSVIEREPERYEFFLYDSNLEYIVSYESDSRQFPASGDGGLYLANENLIVSADIETGGLSLVLSLSGRIETFAQSGGNFIICETGGGYRFYGDGLTPRAYSSANINHFADIGSVYALTGSRDLKTVRILKKDSTASETFFSYDKSYRFSEAKTNRQNERVIFYSYEGFRLYDLNSNIIISETTFPDYADVLDTQYDKTGGNLAVIYQNSFRLYSGANGALLIEITDAKSVVYADFGVSVLDENGTLILYNPDAGILQNIMINPEADSAVVFDFGVIASSLTVKHGQVYYMDSYLCEGEIIGAGKIDDNTFGFAVSNGTACKIFTVSVTGAGSAFTEKFTAEVRGRAEVYFTGGYVFISPMHGDAAAYTLDGRFVRVFEENSYMTETELINGQNISAGYVSALGERYSLVLSEETLEARLYIPGLLGEYGSGALIIDDGAGHLHIRELYGTEELKNTAEEQLGGRLLTDEEKIKYKAR
ncbi:MAG: toll/interleukin-1 receptor domain-containing protein [Oscillospiraceae bacterium]|nr:toll/interleukin-1 receptor domain-containing protein [Oscillospiraceae bacterium]